MLGNQRLAEKTDSLRSSLLNAEQVHIGLQSEYAICRDALNHTMAQLSTQQPQAYADLETQKELLVETQRSWRNCTEELKNVQAELLVQREENVSLKASLQAMNGLRASLAESEERNEELKSKNAEQRAELRQYLDQYQWQFQAGAGSNAEAREPEVKARSSGSLPGRIAEDEEAWPDEAASGQAKSLTPHNVVTGEFANHERRKQTESIWPVGQNRAPSECGT